MLDKMYLILDKYAFQIFCFFMGGVSGGILALMMITFGIQ
jgi:hypothetical protein